MLPRFAVAPRCARLQLQFSEARSLPHVCDDRLDAFRRAAKPRLDRTVIAISHLSCDAKSIGRTANKLAIADALDATIDGDVGFGDRRLHGSSTSAQPESARTADFRRFELQRKSHE